MVIDELYNCNSILNIIILYSNPFLILCGIIRWRRDTAYQSLLLSNYLRSPSPSESYRKDGLHGSGPRRASGASPVKKSRSKRRGDDAPLALRGSLPWRPSFLREERQRRTRERDRGEGKSGEATTSNTQLSITY